MCINAFDLLQKCLFYEALQCSSGLRLGTHFLECFAGSFKAVRIDFVFCSFESCKNNIMMNLDGT